MDLRGVTALKYDNVDIKGLFFGTQFIWPDPWHDMWDEGVAVYWDNTWHDRWSTIQESTIPTP